MSTDVVRSTHELHSVRNQWWCFLMLGIALLVVGSFCIVEPLVPSLASVVVLGFLLLTAADYPSRQFFLGW